MQQPLEPDPYFACADTGVDRAVAFGAALPVDARVQECSLSRA